MLARGVGFGVSALAVGRLGGCVLGVLGLRLLGVVLGDVVAAAAVVVGVLAHLLGPQRLAPHAAPGGAGAGGRLAGRRFLRRPTHRSLHLVVVEVVGSFAVLRIGAVAPP